jgi:hypothetical protein
LLSAREKAHLCRAVDVLKVLDLLAEFVVLAHSRVVDEERVDLFRRCFENRFCLDAQKF